VGAEGAEEEERAGEGGGGSPRTPGGFVRDREENCHLERRLLAVYEELYRCPYCDTKNYVLEGLYEVLQSHGEEVGPAWPIVLALIKGVAQDEEEQHVRQAFMCVQLVRNDLLSGNFFSVVFATCSSCVTTSSQASTHSEESHL